MSAAARGTHIMKFTVKDLFSLPVFSGFKLVAGAGGLNNPIETTEMLDFEFVQGAEIKREHVFDGKSITMSSLLFAKDNPSLITDAVKRLHSFNVSCLAYKPALIKELPKEAIDFANANNFPLIEFGGDEFFEDIIISVRQILAAANDITGIEADLARVIKEDMSVREETRLSKKINIRLKKYVRAISIKDSSNASEEQVANLVRRIQGFEKLNKKIACCKYYDSYFIFLSQDEPDQKRFDALFEDAALTFQLDKSNFFCGISSIRSVSDGFGRVIREAFWAKNIALMEGTPVKYYENLGIYKLVAPEIRSPWVTGYMEEYLAPLLTENDELLQTAKTYILCRGNLDAAAEKLYCHKNTIRYRLSKMHELLDPNSNEKEFSENLSIAVKIYMLNQFL